MGNSKNTLEDVAEEKKTSEISHTYTLSEAFTLKQSLLKEFNEDIGAYNGFSSLGFLGSNILFFASFGITSVPHELIHAGVNSLTGGVNNEIVINSFYGGDLWEKVIPGVEGRVLIPFIGGYVNYENDSLLGNIATYTTPYVLTPLGLYCIMKSREKKSLAWWIAGVGAVSAHGGGIIGDWYGTGRTITSEIAEQVYGLAGLKGNPDSSPVMNTAISFTGLYLGMKMLKYSYRASKGLVNSIRKPFNTKKKELEEIITLTEEDIIEIEK